MGFAAIGCSSSPLRALSLLNPSQRLKGGGEEQNHHPAKLTLSSSHKWRMVIAYDGTKFSVLKIRLFLKQLLTGKTLEYISGWQYQQFPPTIQYLIENALIRITKLDRKELRLVGASRTDTGVHAWGQVAHFVTPFTYDSLQSLHAAMNGLLPPEIRVREICPALPEFHARFSTKSKTYHYKIYNNPIMDPFLSLYAYHSAHKLNPAAMREAAAYFVGKHDFSSFANASHNDRLPDPVKEIFRFDINEMGAVLQLDVEGTGFLYRQVRNMALNASVWVTETSVTFLELSEISWPVEQSILKIQFAGDLLQVLSSALHVVETKMVEEPLDVLFLVTKSLKGPG